MKSNSLVLLKTLLLSTSQINIRKYTTDKKKKKRIAGNFIGLFFLYLMLIGYCISMCIGYGEFGMAGSIPVMCSLVISLISFIFTFFKTNGYLFNFREYDMLMALPFESSTVAACKFMYMYIKSLPFYVSISISMLIGYGKYVHPPVLVYPVWIILSLLLPLIPMVLSSFLGFLIARISTGFRKTNIVQTILTFIFILLCFSFRFIVEAMFREDKVEATLQTVSEVTDKTARIYLPAGWFSGAVTELGISDMLLLIGVSILLFAVVFHLVGKSYRNINSALKSHAASKKYRMNGQKRRSVLQAIVFKEFRRLTGSTTYIVNGTMGMLLGVIFGAVTLIIGLNKIIEVVTQGAPVDASKIQPAIPFIAYFFIGMFSTTACSPSLEGKNYWIIQSLPIEKKKLYQGKMLFNMYLTVPFMFFTIICMCISAKVPVVNTVLYLILGAALCAFSSAWGCVCGIKHMRLDWENEVEVIKQGAAVALYMLPNIIVVMGLIVGVVFMGQHMDYRILTILFTGITCLLAFISYLRAMALAKKS